MSISKTPQFDTMTFTEVWESVNDFLYDYQNVGIPKTIAVDSSAQTLYYLLYARYGNSPIANRDVNQFKYKVFSIIFQFGPTWEKRLEIQDKLRKLSDDDLRLGAKAIYNQALNPSTAPSTGSLEELNYINAQNTANYKKSKLEGFGILWELLKTDVTGEFIGKFKTCFKTFVRPEHPELYITEIEEN